MQTYRRFTFETAERTDVGQKRKVNEDTIFTSNDSQVWLVADGMGGHAAGDFASQTIAAYAGTIGFPVNVEDFKKRFEDRLISANARILKQSDDLGGGTVGSTIAALMGFEDRFICCWSGDSRVYRMRAGNLRQISKDHTEMQALLDAGELTEEEAENYPRKNVITQAIGVSDLPDFDVVEGALADGDTFLICSDGLTEYFENSEIEQVLNDHDDYIELACDLLVHEAVGRGGKDNVSVVITRAIEIDLPESTIVGDYPEFAGQL